MNREEYIKNAIALIDANIFNGDLNLMEHQYQISWGNTGKMKSKTIQPYEDEDAKLDDFFPTTICMNYTIKDPIEFLGNLALECIHAFFNEKKISTKRFKKLADKYMFQKPFKSYTSGGILDETLKTIFNKLEKDYGAWPIKPIVLPEKKKDHNKTPSTLTLFCLECGFEVKTNKKKFEKKHRGLPTCGCGCKMAIDLSDEYIEGGEKNE